MSLYLVIYSDKNLNLFVFGTGFRTLAVVLVSDFRLNENEELRYQALVFMPMTATRNNYRSELLF